VYACAGAKPRAQWNAMLEKSLVEILHEHDNQSGVGWIDSQSKLDAEPHLWENLETVS
jgi:hypothetical protein